MGAREIRYDLLAGLLEYPNAGDFAERLDRAVEALGHGYAAAAACLGRLRERTGGLDAAEVQELYTRTFDINPVCTLEVGWHIYGEDYARGALLVKMRQMLREHRLTESAELPDHLTHVLMLLGRLRGDAADELTAHYLLPGIEKMLAGMHEGESPYAPLLEAVIAVVRADHDVEPVRPREQRGDPPGWKNRLPVFGSPGNTAAAAATAFPGCAAGCGPAGPHPAGRERAGEDGKS